MITRDFCKNEKAERRLPKSDVTRKSQQNIYKWTKEHCSPCLPVSWRIKCGIIFGLKNKTDATEATDFLQFLHHYGTTSCVKRFKEAFWMCWNKLRLCHTNKYSLPNIFLKTHGRSGRSCLMWSLKETLSKSLLQAWITAWLDHFAVPNYTSWLKGKNQHKPII